MAKEKRVKLGLLVRAFVETGFIIFLFYSNLLMGEFTRTNGAGKTIVVALADVITPTNFAIAVLSAVAGYIVVEFLRKRV